MTDPILPISGEILDGLQEIKDFLDPKNEMSFQYFRKHLLPDLKESVLIKKGSYIWRKRQHPKYFCFKVSLMAWLIKRGKT